MIEPGYLMSFAGTLLQGVMNVVGKLFLVLLVAAFALVEASVLGDKLRLVLPDADVVNLLRIQHERQRKEYFPSLGEYTALFGLTKQRAERLKPGALIMHPGPINRGVEIDSELADGTRSVILEQVTNGIAVRMAVLYLCAGGQPEHVTTPLE